MLIPLCYGDSSLRISSWYFPPFFQYDPSNLYLLPQIISVGVVIIILMIPFTFFTHHCMGLHITPYISVNDGFLYNSISHLLTGFNTTCILFILFVFYKYNNIQTYPITEIYSRAYFTQQSKDSITHISIVICSSNFKGGLLY